MSACLDSRTADAAGERPSGQSLESAPAAWELSEDSTEAGRYNSKFGSSWSGSLLT